MKKIIPVIFSVTIIVLYVVINISSVLLNHTNVNCMEILRKYRIQIPKSPNDTYDWGTADKKIRDLWVKNNCAREMIQGAVLSEDDDLPPDVLISKLDKTESDELYYITFALTTHMNERSINYFPVFGSLLAAYRNGVAILPWDDDLDFAADNRDGQLIERLTGNLLEYSDLNDCPGDTPCRMWYLTRDIIITHKKKGVPFKVSMKGKYFPALDLTTFKQSGKTVYIPERELSTGHIHYFSKNDDWVFPLERITINFSYETRKPITFFIPYNARRVIADDYGTDALTTCITSSSHKLFCQQKNCEHVSANHLPKLVFPCSLLPEVLLKSVF